MSGKQFGIAVVINGVDRVSSVVGKVARSVAKFQMNVGKGLSGASERFGIPRLTSQAQKAHAALGSLRERAAGVGKFIAIGFGAATVGAVAMYNKVLEVGSVFRDLSDQTGISTDHLQEWNFAATQSGLSSEEFVKSMQKLSLSLGQAAKGAGPSKLLTALGVKLKDVNGQLRTADSLFPEIVDKISKIKDPTLQAAAANEFFGKQGVKLLSMMKGGKAGLAEFAARARELGIIVGKDTVAGMGDMGDAMQAMQDTVFGVANTIVSALLPALKPLLEQFTTFVAQHQPQIKQFFEDFAKGLPDRIQQAKDLFGELVTKLTPVIGIIGAMVDKFGAADTIISTVGGSLGGAFLAPVLAATTQTVKLGGAILDVRSQIKDLVPWFKTLKMSLLTKVIPAIVSATTSFGAFAVAVMTNPLTWIILAIVAAVALLAYAVYEVYEHWDGIKAWFKAHVWEPLTKAFDAVCTFFSESWDSVAAYFKTSLNDIGEWFKKLGKDLGDWVPDWVKNMFSGNGGANVTINGQPAGAPMGAEQTAQEAARAQLTQTSVNVNFDNMPKGTRVQSETRGPGVFELNQGFAGAVL